LKTSGRGSMSHVECSVVIPVYNEEKVLSTFYERLAEVMGKEGIDYEILFVNDGSTDGSLGIMLKLHDSDPRVSVLSLSRNFGHQIAIVAGLDHARGDAVIVMDADLQDPPEVIPEMLARWREGYDVVYGVRTRRAGMGVFRRVTAALFYRVFRVLSPVSLPLDAGDFRLFSKRAVECLRGIRERNPFVRGLSVWIGLRQVSVEFKRDARLAGESKYSLRKLVRLAGDAVFSFSMFPLRLATFFGVALLLAFLFYLAYLIYMGATEVAPLAGWSYMALLVLFVGGLVLICLGVLGEYVGRIYDEVKHRPMYVVEDFRQGNPS